MDKTNPQDEAIKEQASALEKALNAGFDLSKDPPNGK